MFLPLATVSYALICSDERRAQIQQSSISRSNVRSTNINLAQNNANIHIYSIISNISNLIEHYLYHTISWSKWHLDVAMVASTNSLWIWTRAQEKGHIKLNACNKLCCVNVVDKNRLTVDRTTTSEVLDTPRGCYLSELTEEETPFRLGATVWCRLKTLRYENQ